VLASVCSSFEHVLQSPSRSWEAERAVSVVVRDHGFERQAVVVVVFVVVVVVVVELHGQAIQSLMCPTVSES